MNFNEEMEKELSELDLGGKCILLSAEDKGTDEDYLDIEEKLSLADMETTRMVRESRRNASIGLPCGCSLAESANRMHKGLTGSYYGVDDLLKIYATISMADCFVNDNPSKCDTGCVQAGLTRRLK